MFRKHEVHMDLSTELRDPDDWKAGNLRSFEYPLNITTFAIEPMSCLLAVGKVGFSTGMVLSDVFTTGTAGGVIYIFGGPGVETRLTLPEPVGVKFLQFATSTSRLVCLGTNALLILSNGISNRDGRRQQSTAHLGSFELWPTEIHDFC